MSIVRKSGTSDLINSTTNWGVSVSETSAKKSTLNKGLALVAYVGFILASFLVLPILAGVTFFEASSDVFIDIGIVAGFVATAFTFNVLSKRGPKNALQIDYHAEELRLGSMTAAGAFVRHKVCPLRNIETVSIELDDGEGPVLSLGMLGEIATIRFAQADTKELEALAAKIEQAVDTARSAPISRRIVSTINGFEAGVREIGQRVRSRVNTQFA